MREEVLFDDLFSKLANFSSLMGMLVEGYENENFLPFEEDGDKEGVWCHCLRVKRKLNPTSCFEREI